MEASWNRWHPRTLRLKEIVDSGVIGEVKTIPVNELAKQFPHLSESDLEDIMKNKSYNRSNYNSRYNYDKEDNNTIQVLYFNYKIDNSKWLPPALLILIPVLEAYMSRLVQLFQ